MTGLDGTLRWYGAVLAAGFDAIVNERANRMRWPRGPRRYDLAILVELARLRPRRYTLTLDGERIEVDAVLVAVGNGASYGGGMRICPAADPTDGLLDVVVGGRFDRRTLIRVKPRIYAGTHVAHPLVSTYRARTVTIAAEGITTYADGERSLPSPHHHRRPRRPPPPPLTVPPAPLHPVDHAVVAPDKSRVCGRIRCHNCMIAAVRGG
ncbi:hypothetical protein GCM10029963_06860 [Micromonospora andamanensis]